MNPKQKFRNYFGGREWHLLPRCMILLLVVFSIEVDSRAQSQLSPAVDRSTVDPLPASVHLVDRSEIRFQRLSASAGLSQTRVGGVVQDNDGFIWFGTQYGLNRYDGYKSKVFKGEPGRPGSLSCAYIRSVFVDHAGTLWVGCDRFLNRFEPATETFAHYRIDTGASDQLSTIIERISEDRTGELWLATERGLYRFDPTTTRTIRYFHNAQDPTSIAANGINEAGEDREGRFWVASGGGLEEFDRNTGRVVRRVPLRVEIGRFHEDEFGIFWMTTGRPECRLATWNPRTNVVKCHSLRYKMRGYPFEAAISEILEDRNGTIWFSATAAGLLKLDRVHNRILRYHNDPFDSESLESDDIIYLFQDQEGNIWTCFQATEPNFLSERPQPFESFTYQRGNLVDPLVTSIYEDHNGILWIGSMGGLNRIDRRSGKNLASPKIGNEILAILEDHQGVLFGGTFHEGLKRIDRETGKLTPYSRRSANHQTGPIMRLIYDQQGNLWAAEHGGVGRYDPGTGMFKMYTPDTQNTAQYLEIKEDREGFLWLGAQTGLYRFDPRTTRFNLYSHQSDDPKSLSDNRVNSVHIDHLGTLWVGTQNGLDRLDPASGTFQNYYEKDGLVGDVVGCILEDKHGVLWMSTNHGLSSFDPKSQKFQNFTAADGLSGRDLTGWGACYQSPSGEMFFGGFSGVTVFYPSRIVNRSFVARMLLTDFRLSGNPVPIGAGSPLKQSITRTDSITLSHQQNIFSIEFSALSFFNAETNRYRYKLDGLDNDWHQAGSDQRTATYTTLPAGSYNFEVQGATARGPWGEPGVRLRIEILPTWYQTNWFRVVCAAAFLALVWAAYGLRIQQVRHREKKLRDVIDTMPIFAWTALADGHVDFVNRHWQEYTGLSTEKTLGSGWEAAIHPGDLKRYAENWRASLATGKRFESEVRYRQSADGQYRWFLARAVPLRDLRGKIVKWYGISTDIEDRKRAEQLQADLAHVNRVSTMGELTASLAHEIKQPIGAAVTNAEACARLLDRDQPDVLEAREAALEMAKDSRRAADIIDRIRSLYRKGSSQVNMVDINEVIRELLAILHNEANRHSVTIHTDLVHGLPIVMADRVQLQQVLMNLMLNGIQAMEKTGGVLTIKSQLDQEGRVRISVSDTGIGLPTEKPEQIFDAFFTTKSEGSGMGLAISRTIVESYGGCLWATANSGNGATFHFTLRTAAQALQRGSPSLAQRRGDTD